MTLPTSRLWICCVPGGICMNAKQCTAKDEIGGLEVLAQVPYEAVEVLPPDCV